MTKTEADLLSLAHNARDPLLHSEQCYRLHRQEPSLDAFITMVTIDAK